MSLGGGGGGGFVLLVITEVQKIEFGKEERRWLMMKKYIYANGFCGIFLID